VVLGASFGGITAALTVKALVPVAEIVLLDKAAFFRSAPSALGYVFGMLPLAAITREYGALARMGLQVIHAEVMAVDPGKKRVVSTRGILDYDVLIIATGVRLAYEEVAGLDDLPGVNSSFYETGAPLIELRRRVRAFRGGRVVISVPPGAYTCLPAPYEYALLWADYMKARRIKGIVTMLDPRPKPTPPALAPAVLQAMETHRDVLTYEPAAQLLSVDAGARTIESDIGKLGFDILSVVPPNAAMRFITDAGLGDPFIEADPETFRTATDPAIYALGDTADTPFARTASATISSARIAGGHIARAMGSTNGGRGPIGAVAPHSICYPHASTETAWMLKVDWSPARDETGKLAFRAQGTTDTEAKAAHLRARRQWEATVVRELFGR
jgi:NADPH-dependent 2,4-dienoyl-CoA reductase/sulfur reductase-like enzyme